MRQRISTQSFFASARTVLSALAACALLAIPSCIRDDVNGGGDFPQGKAGRPARLTFDPQLSGHDGGRTRAETYDQTYADFAAFFGGSAQPSDIFGDGTPSLLTDDGTGRAEDRAIGSFRVLVYHTVANAEAGIAAGDLVEIDGEAWNFVIVDVASAPYTVNVATGTYDFVFIANEGTLLADELGADRKKTSQNATLAELKKLTFVYGDDKDIHFNHNIPMVSYYSGVTVNDNNTVTCDDPFDGTSTPVTSDADQGWKVKMLRAAIRLSFGIHIGSEHYKAWKDYHTYAGDDAPVLYIDGLRSEGFLFPDPTLYNDGKTAIPTEKIPAYTQSATVTVKPGKIIEDTAPGSGATLFFDRLIYPEVLFTPVTDADKRVRAYMRFDYGGVAVEKEMFVHAPDPLTSTTGYTLPRNAWVWTKAELFTDLTYVVRVVPWGDGRLGTTEPTQWDLTTNPSELLFESAAGGEYIDIFTDHPDGWVISDVEPSANGAAPVAYTIPGWITSPAVGDSGTTGITTSITVGVEANTGSTIRTGHFTVRAGNIYKKIVVTQLPGGDITDTPQTDVLMYVGAFWKASQYGERLIAVDRPAGNSIIDGPWAAYVVEGRDWIILDTASSTDPNVGTNTPDADGNDGEDGDGKPDFDLAHRVGGYETSVSGNVKPLPTSTDPYNRIRFRIGLNGQYTPTAAKPARYGMILLAYGGTKNSVTGDIEYKYRRVWVRQGEGADYLFASDEGTGNGALASRPMARQFSPYNLTAAGFRNQTAAGQEPSAAVTRAGGVFTNYPSQAGSHFQYAPMYGLYAFNPSYLNVPPAWSSDAAQQWRYSWESAGGAYETCPPGYRRYTDGDNIGKPDLDPVTATVSLDESELAQSLYLNPEGGGNNSNNDLSNSVVGFYADGYFDRRSRDADGLTVSRENYNVAVGGRLFYNPATEASLFFPVAGLRDNDYWSETPDKIGTVRNLGGIGAYWSSSSVRSQNTIDPTAWYLRIDGTVADRRNAANGGYAFSIRCVADENVVGPVSVFTATDVTFGYSGGTMPTEITSTNTDGFTLRWELVGYDGDDADSNFTQGEKPDWLTMPASGKGALPFEEVGLGATANEGAERSVTVQLRQAETGELTTFLVTQGTAPPVRTDVVFAAPGMVGIKKSDYDKLVSGEFSLGDNDKYSLTLKGSSTYAAVNQNGETLVEDIAAAEFGGLESEPVYAVYFKWGSMVAMISGVGDNWSVDDVVWVNDDYDLTANPITSETNDGTGSATSYPYIGYGGFSAADHDTTGTDCDIIDAPTKGEGDVCKELTDGTYRTPHGGTSGWNGTVASNWTRVTTVHNGLYSQGRASTDRSIYLPSAGLRFDSGFASNLGSSGLYWSSTASDDSKGFQMYFQGSTTVTQNMDIFSYALAVRCVQAPKSEPEGVRAPAGVIGYYAEDPDGAGPKKAGDLTLEGDKSLQDEHGYGGGTSPVNVYVAYFKFGSLVATGSQDNGAFTSADIVQAPSSPYKGLAALKSEVALQNPGQSAWSKIPTVPDNELSTDGTIPTRVADGLGDPCAYWFGADGWRLPTARESYGFVGGYPDWAGSQTVSQLEYLNQSSTYNYWNYNGATHAGSVTDPYTGSFPVDLLGDSGYHPAHSRVLPAAGYRDYSSGSILNQGSQGYYWLSTANNNTDGYSLRFINTNVHPSNHNDYARGMGVRCMKPAPTITIPTAGIPAPPGVLGVNSRTGELTLQGSVHYRNTPVATKNANETNEFGLISSDPVYIAYWKWGSTIGMSSVNRAITSQDIVWAPEEYSPSLSGLFDVLDGSSSSNAKYAEIPFASSTQVPYPGVWPSENTNAQLAAGLGDPCKLADGGKYSNYSIPSGGGVYWNGDTYNVSTTVLREDLAYNPSYAGTMGAARTYGNNWSMYLPFVGERAGYGSGTEQSAQGIYWSASSENTLTGDTERAWALSLNHGGASANLNTSRKTGYPIRCVPPTPEPELSTLWGGYDDILYFDSDNRLTIGKYINNDGTRGPVTLDNMVFVRFGSVIGFVNGLPWNTNPIRFSTTGQNTYDYDLIPVFDNSLHGNHSYGPSISSTEYHNITHLREGLGDICKLVGLTSDEAKQLADQGMLAAYTGNDGWRLPTARENANFVGGSISNDYYGSDDWINWVPGSNGEFGYSYYNTENVSGVIWRYYYNSDGDITTVAGDISNPATGRFPIVTDAYSTKYTRILPAAGYVGGNPLYDVVSVRDRGLMGLYASSTPTTHNLGTGFALNFNMSSVGPVSNRSRRGTYDYEGCSGYAVRCLRDSDNPQHPSYTGN